MTVYTNGFEGGTLTQTPSPANSGGLSGTAWTSVTITGGTVVYDNTQVMHGSRSAKITPTSGTADTFAWTVASTTTLASRMYVYMTVLPTADTFLLRHHAGATRVASLHINAAGKLRLSDAAGTMGVWTAAATFPLNQWVRIELLSGVGATTSTGVLSGGAYLGDNTSPIETLFASSTANQGTANLTQVQMGKVSGTYATAMWIDDGGADDTATALMGPAFESASVALASSSTMGITSLVTETVAVSMDSTSALGVAADVTRVASIGFDSSSALSVTGAGTTSGAVALAGSSALSVAATVAQAASVALASSSTIGVAATVTRASSVALVSSSALGVSPLVSHPSSVALSSSSTVVVSPLVSRSLSVAVAGSSTIGVTTTLVRSATVSFDSSSVLAVEMVWRTNLAGNPAFTVGTTYWGATFGAGGAGVFSRPTTGGPDGGPFARMAWTTAQTSAIGNAGFTYSLVGGDPGANCSPGDYVSGRVWVRSSVAQRVTLYLQYLTAAQVSTSTNSTPIILVPNVWTEITFNQGFPAPAGTTHVRALIYEIAGTGALAWQIGDTFDTTKLMMTVGPTVGAYFDGDTAPVDAYSYRWTGTPGSSPSQEYGTQGFVTELPSVPLVSSSTLGVTAATDRVAAVGFAGSSTLGVTPLISHSASVALASTSTLGVSTTIVRAGTILLAGHNILDAQVAGSQLATVPLVQSSALGVAALITGSATVGMTGSSTLSVSPLVTRSLVVALAGSSALAVAGTRSTASSVPFSGANVVGVSTSVTRVSTISLNGVSTFNVVSTKIDFATIPIAGANGLGVGGTSLVSVTISMVGSNVIEIVAEVIDVTGFRDITVKVSIGDEPWEAMVGEQPWTVSIARSPWRVHIDPPEDPPVYDTDLFKYTPFITVAADHDIPDTDFLVGVDEGPLVAPDVIVRDGMVAKMKIGLGLNAYVVSAGHHHIWVKIGDTPEDFKMDAGRIFVKTG